MRRRVFTRLALLLAAAALLGACKATDTAGNVSASAPKADAQAAPAAPPTGTTEVHADGVRRVTVAELKAMLDAGSAAVYDTRAQTAYEAEHITGSRSMPYDQVAAHTGELPRDKTLVFYCTWPNEHTSAGAALTLKQKGIENTAALLGGLNAWKDAKLPTEGTAASK